jgi:hypothetical protein
MRSDKRWFQAHRQHLVVRRSQLIRIVTRISTGPTPGSADDRVKRRTPASARR